MGLSMRAARYVLCATLILALWAPLPVLALTSAEQSAIADLHAAWGPYLDPLGWTTDYQNACGDGVSTSPFEGLLCSASNPSASVTGLSFMNYGITGTIPQSIGAFAAMTQLELRQNNLSGSIPDSLYQATGLINFLVSQNQLSGSISDSIGQMTSISQLDIWSNYLTGTLPNTLSALTSMRYLYAQTNGFTGTIPAGLGNAVGMRYCFLSDNHLSGTIPDIFNQWPNLQGAYFHNNQLEGTLPSSIGNSPLRYISFTNNNLNGTIPTSLCTSSSLYLVDIGGNHLEGPIPSNCGSAPAMESFAANNNSLSGPIPSSFAASTTLQVLALSNNFFSGSLPAFNSPSLVQLKVDNNSLSICPNVTLSSSLTACSLIPQRYDTSCLDEYAAVCQPPLVAPVTTLDPVVPQSPTIPPPAPTMAPCQSASPSSGQWSCINGEWTSLGDVHYENPTFVVTTPVLVVVNGTLYVPGDIVFTGLGQEIKVVNGCVLINGTVQLQLSETDAEQIRQNSQTHGRQTLISQSTTCSNELSTVPLSMSVSGKKSCKKLSVSNDPSQPSQLTALFHIDSKGCNTKWIILGSVLGAVVVLAAVGVTLYFVFRPDPLKAAHKL